MRLAGERGTLLLKRSYRQVSPCFLHSLHSNTTRGYNNEQAAVSEGRAATHAWEGVRRMCRPKWLSLLMPLSLVAVFACSGDEGKKPTDGGGATGGQVVVDAARQAGRDAESLKAADEDYY